MRNSGMCLQAALWCALVSPFASAGVFSQEVGGVTVEQIDDTVRIHYMINAGTPDDLCRVNLLLSTDGGLTFNIRPKMVKGLDRLVPAGRMQELVWLPLNEGIELNGDRYVFKVTADILIVSEDVEFVSVNGGEFAMGDFKGTGDPDEMPVHSVTIGNFELSKYEVTNRQYAKFLARYGRNKVRAGEFSGERMFDDAEHGLHFRDGVVSVDPGFEDAPMRNVTWYGANEFCSTLGFRLPTEAEWEYAARVQGKKVIFADGKDDAAPEDINYDASGDSLSAMGSEIRNRKTVTRVGTFLPNGLGLFDMSGNVWEWCQDWYDASYYDDCLSNPRFNPAGPWFGDFKVIRGGGYGNNARAVRTTERSFKHPGKSNPDIGFRVARN